MYRAQHIAELTALQAISETLNSSNDMEQMLQEVLPKLLQVTGLNTGWIFLSNEESEYSFVAEHNLPPALTWGDRTPMCSGSCWCLRSYWRGSMNQAVNIIECQRLEDAVEQQWGDTRGIAHHATIPLKAGSEYLGLLNVAAPGKNNFTDEELALLQSVALQIGTAIKRTKLFQAEQKRAAHYEKLGEISRRIGSILDLHRIPEEVVNMLCSEYEWPVIAFFMKEGASLSLRALWADQVMRQEWRAVPPAAAGPVGTAYHQGKIVIVTDNKADFDLEHAGVPAFASAVAVPLLSRNETQGVLFVASPKKGDFDEPDVEIMKAVVDHIGLAIENARLYAQRREIARMEERNRLARDLHDSVSQTLFSLTMTARGAASMFVGSNQAAEGALQDIQTLAQDALREMRSLILQMRPAGLEQGLLTALQRYGEGLGLTVNGQLEGLHQIPRAVEEALWRIGQESLNNVSKHADTKQVSILLRITAEEASLQVSDNGRGFAAGDSTCSESVGLIGMRERIEMLNGTLSVHSVPGEGTRITACIPFYAMCAAGNEASR